MKVKMTNSMNKVAVCFVLMLLPFLMHGQTGLKETSFSERLYLNTDKELYLAGEIIWFKIYCTNGDDNPVTISKVAYVEILDRNNKPVIQGKVVLTDNVGNGSFYLPLTVNSDYYIIRAYTSLMKSQGSNSFFEKRLSVINTLKPVTAKSINKDTSAIRLVLQPESGQWVEGIESKIAFRLTDKYGVGLNLNGAIINSGGDTVKRIVADRFGTGSFILRSSPAEKYKASFLLPGGRSFEQSLPMAEKTGYVMGMTDEDNKVIKIKIEARVNNSGKTGETVVLLNNNGGTKILQQAFLSYENGLTVQIDKQKLSEGINSIVLVNSDQQVVGERPVFIRSKTDLPAAIQVDKQAPGTRQPVNINVSFSQEIKQNDLVNYSVAVYRIDTLSLNNSAYHSFLSGLKSFTGSPGYFSSDADGDIDKALDNLVLTSGQSHLKNNSSYSGRGKACSFTPEYNGHFITGKVVSTNDGSPAANMDCFLTTPSTPFGFHIARSDSMGIVRFEVKNYYGPGEVIGQVVGPGNYKIEFFNPFTEQASSLDLPEFAVSPTDEELLLQKNISMQAQNIYHGDSLRKFMMPNLPDTLPFFGKAEFVYKLDDYKRFATMEEVLREYVTPINVLLRNGSLQMSIFDEAADEIYRDNILVLVDGVPLKDYNKIFSFDPLKVRKLSIVPRKYLYGTGFFSGIASFETYSGKFENSVVDPSLTVVDYDGFQMQRKFYSPDHALMNGDKTPDMRSTLYWAPELVSSTSASTDLHFYTSDLKGKFIVVVEGLSNSGNPVKGSAIFEVR
ncbi:MAG TPA: hypothetical protein VF476_16965 [Chitinophagaceae bacterium]